MENFNLVDGGVLFVLVVSALLAYSRGFVREVLSILGWVVAAVVAFMFAPDVEPLMAEVPILSGIIGTNCELGILAAFGLVFVAALVVVSIFTPLIAGAVQNSALGPVDQGLGFLFGLARGAVLVLVALVLYNVAAGEGEGMQMVEDSRTVEILAAAQTDLMQRLEEQQAMGWLGDQYQRLIAPCTGNGVEEGTTPGGQ